jgi:hypothetical protein
MPPYYDLRKKAVFEGWWGTSYHVELAAEPEEYENDDTPKRVEPEGFKMDDIVRAGVLPHEVWDALGCR